jgi:hypothetical protein
MLAVNCELYVVFIFENEKCRLQLKSDSASFVPHKKCTCPPLICCKLKAKILMYILAGITFLPSFRQLAILNSIHGANRSPVHTEQGPQNRHSGEGAMALPFQW